MAYCSNCGAQNKAQANYCTACGKQMDTADRSRKNRKGSRFKKWLGWSMVVLLLIAGSSYFFLRQEGQVLGFKISKESQPHTFAKTSHLKQKDTFGLSKEQMETPDLAFMDEDQWKTCIESGVYSEEECLAADEYYAYEVEELSAFQTYTNDRFGFQIDYPGDFNVSPPPENGDGMEAEDDSASFVVYGSHMTVGGKSASELDSIDQVYTEDLSSLEETHDVSYHTVKDNWYAISYVDGETIVYKKAILGDDFIAEFILEYPENNKEEYEAIVNQMIESFEVL